MDIRQKLSQSRLNPQKILKTVISVSVVLLVMWIFMVSQMEFNGSSEPADPVKQEKVDSINTLKGKQEVQPAGSSEEPDIFMNAFTTFLVLLALLAAVWFWVRKRNNGTSQSGHRELDTQLLGEGAELKIMEINHEIWVLGITSNSVNLLHRYPRNEWKEPSDTTLAEEKSFYDIFRSKS